MSGKKPTYLTEAAFRDKLSASLPGDVEVTMAALPDLIYQTGTRTRIWHPDDGYDVADFDAIIVRKVGRYGELGIAVAHYADSKNIPFTDSYLLTSGNGKLACAFIRALRGIPVPETLYGPAEALLASGLLEFPVVVKADIGRAGQDNYLVSDAAQYRDVLSTYPAMIMVTQAYIPNEGDYRILVMNYQPVLAIWRQKAGNSHVNNTSMGGQASLIELEKLPKRVLRSAIQASRLEKVQVAGVDIIIDSVTGLHRVLEVNRAPQIPSGTFIDEKIGAYAGFITQLVNGPLPHRPPIVIGRAENVAFPEIHEEVIDARIDTGAATSSIFGTATEVNGRLEVHFLAGTSATAHRALHYFDEFKQVTVASSNGDRQRRYKVKVLVVLNKRRIRAWFTIADRSTQAYPVLIGRNVLTNKFVVDVSRGQPNFVAERRRSISLQHKKER